jgi:hypothetical protein
VIFITIQCEHALLRPAAQPVVPVFLNRDAKSQQMP